MKRCNVCSSIFVSEGFMNKRKVFCCANCHFVTEVHEDNTNDGYTLHDFEFNEYNGGVLNCEMHNGGIVNCEIINGESCKVIVEHIDLAEVNKNTYEFPKIIYE